MQKGIPNIGVSQLWVIDMPKEEIRPDSVNVDQPILASW